MCACSRNHSAKHKKLLLLLGKKSFDNSIDIIVNRIKIYYI